jgi:hypothetical protein
MADGRRGFLPVTFSDGTWKLPDGAEVPWYEVQTELLSPEEVNAALDRVLSVYGVSDVVVDAFSQLRKELQAVRTDGAAE